METKFEYLFYDVHSKSFYYEFHRHPCCELVYYISGRGISNIDHRDFPFEKNSFSFMPANSMHNRNYLEDTEFIAVGFQFNSPIELIGGVYGDINEKILSLMQEIKEEFVNKKRHFQLRLNILISEIIIQFDRMLNNSGNTDELNSFKYIKNYIDVHYNEKINFINLAELSHYSYDHFRHKFKEFTGHPPNHYLMIRRIESAKEMLLRTDKNIIKLLWSAVFQPLLNFVHFLRNMYQKHLWNIVENARQLPKIKLLKSFISCTKSS